MAKKHKKKIVCIGGGNGPAISIQALKTMLEDVDIAAVIAMFDTGGSTGRLRQEFGTQPFSDLMRATLSLSKYDYEGILRPIFYKTRFKDAGKLDGHNLGNLFMTLSAKYDGDWLHVLRALGQAAEIVGKVEPVTLDVADLIVELSDGQHIKTESAIDEPSYDRKLRIKKMWLGPRAKIYPAARKLIEKADYIVLGPGSTYTSIVANLIVDGMKEALKISRGKIIYLTGHVYATNKETGPETLSERIVEIERYLPRVIDIIVYDDQKPGNPDLIRYQREHFRLLPKDVENIPKQSGGHFLMKRDLIAEAGKMSSAKLIPVFKEIIKDEVWK